MKIKRFLAFALAPALMFSAALPAPAASAQSTLSPGGVLKLANEARKNAPYLSFDGTFRAAGSVSGGDGDDAYSTSVVLEGNGAFEYRSSPSFSAHLSAGWSYIVEDTERNTSYQAYLMEDKSGYDLYTGKRLPSLSEYVSDETESETGSEKETEKETDGSPAGYTDPDGFTWKYERLDKTAGDYLRDMLKSSRFSRYLKNGGKTEEKNGVIATDKVLSVMDLEQMLNDNASLIDLFGQNKAKEWKRFLPVLDGVKLNTELLTDKKTNMPKAVSINADGSNFSQVERYLTQLINNEEEEEMETEKEETNAEEETEGDSLYTFSAAGLDASGSYSPDKVSITPPEEILELKKKAEKEEKEETTEAETTALPSAQTEALETREKKN